MKKEPSLFVFDDGNLYMTVDLAKISLIAKRPGGGGGYWLNAGGQSIPVPQLAGAAIHDAWVAYQGKFNPKTDR